MSKDLLEVKKNTVLASFSVENGMDDVVSEATKIVDEFEYNVSTAKGRKEAISLARKVSTLKTLVDGYGKDLTSDMKAKCKIIDSNRKLMRDQLDNLRDRARKPVTDWEEEQERIKKEKEKLEETKRLAEQKESDHEIAILMHKQYLRDEEDKRLVAEKAEQERQQQLRAQQEERDRQITAQAKAAAEKEAKAATERAERAEREKIAAQERAKLEAETADRRAKEAAERARLEEIDRQNREAQKVREEQNRLEANKRHVGSVRRKAKEAMIGQGLSEEMAKKLILAIHNNKIPNISIKY